MVALIELAVFAIPVGLFLLGVYLMVGARRDAPTKGAAVTVVAFGAAAIGLSLLIVYALLSYLLGD